MCSTPSFRYIFFVRADITFPVIPSQRLITEASFSLGASLYSLMRSSRASPMVMVLFLRIRLFASVGYLLLYSSPAYAVKSEIDAGGV